MLGSFTEMGHTGQEQVLDEDVCVCGNEEFCIKKGWSLDTQGEVPLRQLNLGSVTMGACGVQAGDMNLDL